MSVTRDGRTWPIGTQSDVSWINDGVEPGLTITSAIPPDYDVYATVVIVEGDAQRSCDQSVLVRLLTGRTTVHASGRAAKSRP